MIYVDACVRHSAGTYRWSGEIGEVDPFTAIQIAVDRIMALDLQEIDWTSLEIVLTQRDTE